MPKDLMIAMSDLEKTYSSARGNVHAIQGVSLSVTRGEIFGIIGKSGAGKSTLIRCINMLERPTQGSVLVDGQEMTVLPEEELRQVRKKIGMIFQHFNLLTSRTVYDNVAFPLELAGWNKSQIREAVMPLLELVGLADKKDQYPAQLSGGQKQRVGIARACQQTESAAVRRSHLSPGSANHQINFGTAEGYQSQAGIDHCPDYP